MTTGILRRFHKSLILVTLLMLPVVPASAFLASMKHTGMAGSGVAYPQDAESGAYNPALISLVGDRMDVGLSPIYTRGYTEIQGSPNPALNQTYDAYTKHWVFNPHFGITKSFCNCKLPITFGFVVYNNADIAYTKYSEVLPLLGTSPVRLSYIQENFSPMIAIRLNKCHSIGIAFNTIVQRLKVNGLENFDSPMFSSVPGKVTNNGADIETGHGLTFGWTGKILPGVRLGVSYSPKTKILPFRKYQGFIAQKGHINAPTRWWGGAAIRWTEKLVTTTDVIWEGWNAIRSLHNPLNVLGSKLGDDNGSGFGWRDRTYYRFGVEYRATPCLEVRMGFRHARTTISPEATAVNLLVNECIEDFITSGFTYRFKPNMELNFFYAHGLKHTVRGENSIPVIPFGGGEVNLTQGRDAFGFGLGYCY